MNPNELTAGVLAVDKPAGMTSHDVVNRIRRLYNTKQVGHTGTLDPLATGVLVILIGRAAKAAEYVTAGEKGYRALLRLGCTTDTGDITGNVISKSNDIPSFAELEKVAASFVGESMQIPPMYSALKVDGKKLYDLARQGIEIEREARPINIYSLSSKESENKNEFILDVRCSKGTYIRTLCEDIGKALGCGGTMADLRRTYTGGFSIDKCVTIESIEALEYDKRIELLYPTESLFAEFPEIKLSDFFARLAHSGAQIYLKKIGVSYEIGKSVRLSDKNGFFAIGEVREYPDGPAVKPLKHFVL